jgi:nucleoside-diphosphate-sugar epimerase
MELLVEKKAFGNIIHAGGGDKNMISLRDFILTANPSADIQVVPGGDLGFAFDISTAQRLTGWEPSILVTDKIPVIADNISKGICDPNL